MTVKEEDTLKTKSMNSILCAGILFLNLHNNPIELHFTGKENAAVMAVFYALR